MNTASSAREGGQEAGDGDGEKRRSKMKIEQMLVGVPTHGPVPRIYVSFTQVAVFKLGSNR